MAFVSSAQVLPGSVQRSQICVRGFFGSNVLPASVKISPAGGVHMAVLPIFTKAMEDFRQEYPLFAKFGWGASVKAERWNGRHAMFGLLALVITAYCKGHGLIPDPSTTLDLSQWGNLAALGDRAAITNERAIILIAHVHVLLVSIAAAIAPFSFQDKLFLQPGEKDEEPAGLFPPVSFGLTKDAELWNSRVAMLGVISIVGTAAATRTPVLDVINIGLGKILY